MEAARFPGGDAEAPSSAGCASYFCCFVMCRENKNRICARRVVRVRGNARGAVLVRADTDVNSHHVSWAHVSRVICLKCLLFLMVRD